MAAAAEAEDEVDEEVEEEVEEDVEYDACESEHSSPYNQAAAAPASQDASSAAAASAASADAAARAEAEEEAVRLQHAREEERAATRIQAVHRGKVARRQNEAARSAASARPVQQVLRWRYQPSNGKPIVTRVRPEVDGDKTKHRVMPQEVIEVCEEKPGPSGILFLKLAGDNGWLFDEKPGVGVMCVRVDPLPEPPAAAENPAAAAAPAEASEEEQRRAAMKIQSMRRGQGARRSAAARREQAKKEREEEERAAVRIQALQRGKLARRQVAAAERRAAASADVAEDGAAGAAVADDDAVASGDVADVACADVDGADGAGDDGAGADDAAAEGVSADGASRIDDEKEMRRGSGEEEVQASSPAPDVAAAEAEAPDDSDGGASAAAFAALDLPQQPTEQPTQQQQQQPQQPQQAQAQAQAQAQPPQQPQQPQQQQQQQQAQQAQQAQQPEQQQQLEPQQQQAQQTQPQQQLELPSAAASAAASEERTPLAAAETTLPPEGLFHAELDENVAAESDEEAHDDRGVDERLGLYSSSANDERRGSTSSFPALEPPAPDGEGELDTQEIPVFFNASNSKARLEGMLRMVPGAQDAAIVVHGDPGAASGSSSMSHPVVTTVATALARQGLHTLRFNFRGVGQSQSVFSAGAEAPDDVEAALLFVRRSTGATRFLLCGHALGAEICMEYLSARASSSSAEPRSPRLSASLSISGVVSIACSPPQLLLSQVTQPLLAIQAELDPRAPLAEVQAALERRAREKARARARLEVLPDCDARSFTPSQLSEVAQRLRSWVSSVVRPDAAPALAPGAASAEPHRSSAQAAASEAHAPSHAPINAPPPPPGRPPRNKRPAPPRVVRPVTKMPDEATVLSDAELRIRAERELNRMVAKTADNVCPSIRNYCSKATGKATMDAARRPQDLPKLTLDDLPKNSQDTFMRVAKHEALAWLKAERQRAVTSALEATRLTARCEKLSDWYERKQRAEEEERQRKEKIEEERLEQERIRHVRWKKRHELLQKQVADWAFEKDQRDRERARIAEEAAREEEERRKRQNSRYRAKQKAELEEWHRRKLELEREQELALQEARAAEERSQLPPADARERQRGRAAGAAAASASRGKSGQGALASSRQRFHRSLPPVGSNGCGAGASAGGGEGAIGDPNASADADACQGEEAATSALAASPAPDEALPPDRAMDTSEALVA